MTARQMRDLGTYMVNEMYKIMFVIIPAVVAAIGATIVLTNATVGTSITTQCLPTSVDQIIVSFPIKQPSTASMPPGYKLQAIDNQQGQVWLYYSDHSLCPFDKDLFEQIDNGAIVVGIRPLQMTNAKQYYIDFANSSKGTPQEMQFVEVNGHPGLADNPHQGVSEITRNDVVVESHPISLPGTVAFYNEKDGTIYTVKAMQPMDKLLAIAQTIP